MTLTEDDLLNLQADMIVRYNECLKDLQEEFKAHAELLRLDYQSAIRKSNEHFSEHVAKVAEHNKMLDDKADAREATWNTKHIETICHNEKTQRLIALATLAAANPGWTPERVVFELNRLKELM